MRQMIVVFLLLFVGSAWAKDKQPYDLKITVVTAQGVESEYRRSWIKGGGHSVTAHVQVTANDGNTYQLLAHHKEDVLLPGTYSAAIEKGNMRVCKPKSNDQCEDLEFHIEKVEPTKN
jgi:hypothetical protein